MTPEHRAGTEFRVSGRTLSGVAMPYGTISPDFRERFVPGAFAPVPAVALNLQHDRRMEILPAGGLVLNDTARALEVRAELPADSAAIRLVQRGALNGFSVEFNAREERREAGVRVIERAELTGLALVDAGAYPQATAEVRARSGRTLRARIPVDTDVACECAGGGCTHANFQAEALGEMWGDVFRKGTKRIAAAYLNSYAQPIASTSRGTLRGRIVGVNGFQVDMDIPDSQAGRDLIAAWESSGIVVRPFIRDMQGDVVDGVRHVTGGRLAAFIVSATDAREGWPDPEFVPTPGMDGERAAPQRRRRLWL